MKRQLCIALACCLMLLGLPASANFTQLIIFGDSLSDSGNNYLALGGATTPDSAITSNAFTPAYPYASGRYSNGPTWAEDLAATLGLPLAPSLAGGTNYAFGGARTGPEGSSFPYSLRDQVNMFATDHTSAANDALYVLAGGGNNVRSALEAVGGGADPTTTALSTVNAYVTDMLTMLGQLEGLGAQRIVVWNIADIGLAPAVTSLGSSVAGYASFLSDLMNNSLLSALGAAPAVAQGVDIFDLYGLMHEINDHPTRYGLTNVSDACGAVASCDPDTYLFWDGVHPTAAGHRLIGSAMYSFVPEPSSLLLVAIAIGASVVCIRRSQTY